MSGDSPRAQDDTNLNNVHFVSLIERSIHYQNSTFRFDASIIGAHVHFYALSIFFFGKLLIFDMAPFTAFMI